ncbi:hypothetical protein [Sphingomonas bacterium]|uniref:hypothetical protein n=1 Tax=Sphingomonas bacterium TaxID=1895847 RepID=UPI001C2DC139|nr:hypothetical protein [Sphingomonas bacterium]
MPWTRVAATGLAYLIASATAMALTRFEGGAAFLWVANAVLLASLMTVPCRHWSVLVAVCWLAGAAAAG